MTEATLVPVKVEVPANPAGSVAQEARGLAQVCESFRVLVREDLAHGSELLRAIADMRKRAEKARRFLVDPLNAHVKAINAAFAQVTDPLDVAERAVKARSNAWQALEDARIAREQAEQRRMEREAAEQARKLADAGVPAELIEQVVEQPPPPVAEPARGPVRSESGAGIKFVMRWKIEVENIALVPPAFLLVNEAAVLGAVRAGAVVPGIRAWQEKEAARA